MYKIFIKHDENMCVTSIESDLNKDETSLFMDGYEKVDEGENAEIYAFPLRYLLSKHRKPLYDDDFNPNFKYENGKVVALTKAEKNKLFTKPEPEPTDKEKIDSLTARVSELETALSELTNKMNG